MLKLRFPEFRDAPEWEERLLADFLSESRIPGSKGDVAKKITVKLWGNGVFGKSEATQGSANTQYFRRKAGQFIYSKLDFLNQAFGIIPTSLDKYESTVDLPCFDIANGLNPAFLLEYVKRKDFYKKKGETADGSRKAKRIQTETFLSFSILLPEPVEQQKIADCLSSIDELIAAQAQKLDTLKLHKKGLMQQLFPAEGETAPKLRFPGFRDAGDWDESKLGDLARFASGGTPSKEVPEYWGGKIPWISASSMYDVNIDRSDLNITELAVKAGARIAKKGTMLILVRGSILHSRIPMGIAVADVAFNQDVKALVLSKKLVGRFLLYQLLASENKILSTVGETGIGAGKIDTNDLKEFLVRLPSLREQQIIVDCLSSLDELIIAQARKLGALKAHKKGLMQQLFPSADEAQG